MDLLILAFNCSLNGQTPKGKFSSDKTESSRIHMFEVHFEHLRLKYSIPSISAGIVKNKILVWKKGFGYADMESKIVPDENTIYHLASITKTFGSIILMQLVEQGKVKLK
jgi:CubicO group peptidase (beta-lactamase class C family)